jgi:phosphatidylserine decarboxylase
VVVKYFNRYINAIEVEKVMAGETMEKIYGSWWGRLLEWVIASTNIFSNIVGEYYKSKWSKSKIKPFIDDYNINVKDFRYGSIRSKEFHDSFKTFDEFFTRDLQTSARTFVAEKKIMPAFAEGRYFATESIHDILKFQSKEAILECKT